MNMLRNTITGLLMFVFAVAADVPSEPQRMRRYGEEAEVTPHGRPELASPAMKMEVSNDQLEDAAVQEKSVQAAGISKLNTASNTTATAATSGCRRRRLGGSCSSRRRTDCRRRRRGGSCSSRRRRNEPNTQAACEGTTLKIYGEDHAEMSKSLAWTLKCKHVGSTVRFQGTWRDETEGEYYLEVKDSSQVAAFLSGTFTSRVEFIQGTDDPANNDVWRNAAGGLWATPGGHLQKTNGVDVAQQEQAWVLYNSQEKVVSPLWMAGAVGADQPSSCAAPAVAGDCSCEHYQCVLQVQCMASRIKDAPAGTAKDACTKMMSGATVTDQEKQCCLELVDPCKQEDPLGDCAFRAVMHYNGHAFLEQEDGTEKVANDSRPGDQATSLDEAMTGKRSC